MGLFFKGGQIISAVSCQAQEAKAAGGSGAAEPDEAPTGLPWNLSYGRNRDATRLRHPRQGAPGSVSVTEVQKHSREPTTRGPHNGPTGVVGGSPHSYPHRAPSAQARSLPSGTGFATWGDAQYMLHFKSRFKTAYPI